jgi:Glycosyl transferase family 2
MLSLVSVFNDAAKVQARLVASLKRQDAPHQLVLVDNRDGRFSGAAAALNWGARQAVGDWIVFLHQDVELLAEDWLGRTEQWLTGLDRNGWHGVVGRNARGRWRGLLCDRAMVFGEPFDRPVEVQTLDEVVLIHANHGPGYLYFDERVPGWHAYGVDACCNALRRGARNYVLPAPIWHDSNSTNQAGLRLAHAYVWEKHRRAFGRIYTTCGVLPHPYGWSGSWRVSQAQQTIRHWFYAPWRWPGDFRNAFSRTPWEVLEEWTRDEAAVDCLHEKQDTAPLLAGSGFTDRTAAPRRILHHYRGPDPPPRLSDCVVIAPELAGRFRELRGRLPSGLRRLIVCLHLDDRGARPDLWRRRLGCNSRCALAVEADETRWAILEARQ